MKGLSSYASIDISLEDFEKVRDYILQLLKYQTLPHAGRGLFSPKVRLCGVYSVAPATVTTRTPSGVKFVRYSCEYILFRAWGQGFKITLGRKTGKRVTAYYLGMYHLGGNYLEIMLDIPGNYPMMLELHGV